MACTGRPYKLVAESGPKFGTLAVVATVWRWGEPAQDQAMAKNFSLKWRCPSHLTAKGPEGSIDKCHEKSLKHYLSFHSFFLPLGRLP